MDQVTQDYAAMVEETTAASGKLSQEAENLRGLLSQFRFAQHSSIKLSAKATDAPAARATPRGQRVSTVRATGGAAALAYENWEDF
jgi:methyl-accepting chemotaxis protein